MENNVKLSYEAPEASIVQIWQEGLICQSDGIIPMGDPELL
jgi:hypothetical protein